jgi:hypothetical protein
VNEFMITVIVRELSHSTFVLTEVHFLSASSCEWCGQKHDQPSMDS